MRIEYGKSGSVFHSSVIRLSTTWRRSGEQREKWQISREKHARNMIWEKNETGKESRERSLKFTLNGDHQKSLQRDTVEVRRVTPKTVRRRDMETHLERV